MSYSQLRKNSTATAIEQMVTIPVEDRYSKKNIAMKIAKLKNLSAAIARYFAEDDRLMALVTLTFGAKSRADFERMSNEKIVEIGEIQYNSLMSLTREMRRSKRFKSDVRYFAVVEVQPEGGALHAHLAISVDGIEEMFALVEFIHDFKGRHTELYTFNSKDAFPIDRSHIGVSSALEKVFNDRYTLRPYLSKGDRTRTENLIQELEQRKFLSGSWTPLEFYTKTMMEDRYEEQITKYLLKTVEGEFALDTNTIKEGVAKCQLGHDTKSLLDSENYINKLHVLFVRKVGSRVYTHSRFPFSWSLYQKYYRALIAYDTKYKLFYSCIEDARGGDLVNDAGVIFDGAGNVIAGGKNAK